MTHQKTERCPYVDDVIDEQDLGTCCMFDGEELRSALRLLEEADFLGRIKTPLTAEDAIVLGQAMERKGNSLSEDCDWSSASQEQDAIGAILAAAKWLQQIGADGFGVRMRR